MTEHFPQAFKRMPERIKNVKTFRELQQNFKDYAKDHAPMTNKQNRALAVEARRMGIKNTSMQIRFMRNNKQQIRYKDAITGIWTRPDGTFKRKGEKK